MNEITTPTAMAARAPAPTMAKDSTTRLPQPCTTAAAMARMGVINGATSMAPMTTAAELLTRPKAAIAADSTISVKNCCR